MKQDLPKEEWEEPFVLISFSEEGFYNNHWDIFCYDDYIEYCLLYEDGRKTFQLKLDWKGCFLGVYSDDGVVVEI